MKSITMVWWLIIVGIIFSIWYGYKEGKTQKVKTYIGDSIKHLWIGMAIAYFVLSMILTKMGWDTAGFSFFYFTVWTGYFCFREHHTIPSAGDRGHHCFYIGHCVCFCGSMITRCYLPLLRFCSAISYLPIYFGSKTNIPKNKFFIWTRRKKN